MAIADIFPNQWVKLTESGKSVSLSSTKLSARPLISDTEYKVYSNVVLEAIEKIGDLILYTSLDYDYGDYGPLAHYRYDALNVSEGLALIGAPSGIYEQYNYQERTIYFRNLESETSGFPAETLNEQELHFYCASEIDIHDAVMYDNKIYIVQDKRVQFSREWYIAKYGGN